MIQTFMRGKQFQFVRRLAGRSRVIAALAGAALLLNFAVGCQDRRGLAPVEGVVRLDGEPLTKGIVTFVPESGRSATGAIRSDGTFQLETYGQAEGALVGAHRVTITATETPTGPPDFDVDRPAVADKKPLVPARYANSESSGLTFEVKADMTNYAELDLKSK